MTTDINLGNDVLERMRTGTVRLDDIALIFRHELPTLTDAQLYAVLTAKQTDSRPVAQMLEPIARAELARRRQAKANAGEQFTRSA